MKAARAWRWLAAAALFVAPLGCNQIAGIEEGELALCDDGQAMAEGGCPDQILSGNASGATGSGATGSGSTGSGSSGSSSGGGGGACPAMWTAAGGRCYLVESMHRDWPMARKRCVDLGGDLAAITSPEELAEVSALLDADTWIGGHDRTYEGTFEWSNGEPWDYEPWVAGFGSDNTEKRDCVNLAVQSGALPAFEMRNCIDDLDLLCERAP